MELFEAELARRGLRYSAASSPGSACVVWVHGARLVVSLDNLARQLTGAEDDAQRVSWFTDQVVAAARPASLTTDGLYWFLEPGGHQDDDGYREPVSPWLDRVLVHAGADGALIRWMTPRALAEMGLSAAAASRYAWSGLDAALARAEQVRYPAPGGATLLSFATALPSKASLLLAPSLRAAVEDAVGWPVLAVAPDRDFTYVERRAPRPHRPPGRYGYPRARPRALPLVRRGPRDRRSHHRDRKLPRLKITAQRLRPVVSTGRRGTVARHRCRTRSPAPVLAWASATAAAQGVRPAGALGPAEAFGLTSLERACAEA